MTELLGPVCPDLRQHQKPTILYLQLKLLLFSGYFLCSKKRGSREGSGKGEEEKNVFFNVMVTNSYIKEPM